MIDSMTLRDSAGDVEGIGSESFVSSEHKAHSALTKEQGLVLLSKLAKDDGFRARFEQNPAKALSEIGIPQQQTAGLREACLAPRKLAAASELEAAGQKLAADLDTSVLVFVIPTAKF